MSHARRVLWAASAGFALVSAVACGSMDLSSFDDSGKSDYGDAGTSPAPGDSAAAPNGRPQATGIVLVHAATFPSFRLCFQNFPDRLPQPDSRVMPEANVVGVEIGTVVRLDPMEAPGTVYVIWEPRVRTDPAMDNPPPCSDLIKEIGKKSTNRTLLAGDYHIATSVDEPLGKDHVSVLAITGCGNATTIAPLDSDGSKCGEDWVAATGNLKALSFDLGVLTRKSTKELPVQLFQMSPELAALDPLTVTFGPLAADGGVDGGKQATVPVGDLYEGAEDTSLAFDQESGSQIYNDVGFRIDGKGGFSAAQSLAEVQELSAPRELPTDYYKAASSYALLLLGDPAHKPTLDNDTPNPNYNPRRAVHILAVPVIDQDSLDAGTPEAPDSGIATE